MRSACRLSGIGPIATRFGTSNMAFAVGRPFHPYVPSIYPAIRQWRKIEGRCGRQTMGLALQALDLHCHVHGL